MTLDARNPDLEAAIAANPLDDDAWRVFTDWLQTQGDPRGELAALQDGHKPADAEALLARHADYFLGDFAAHQTVHDEGYNNASSHLRDAAQEAAWQATQKQAFLWRHGFISRVRLSHDSYSDGAFDGSTADILTAVLKHPSARYVAELAFQSNGDPNEDDLQTIIDAIAAAKPASVRKITFGDNVDQISWHHTGNLGDLWPALPNLRVLEIETGEFEVGKLVAPKLERAIFITGGLSQSCGADLARAEFPNIQHLEIYYGDENYGAGCSIAEVAPLLARTDLTKLTYLGLKNSEFSDAIAAALGDAPILKTLKTLDLSLGTLTDAGVDALVAHRAALAHLECLDLTRNFLTDAGKAKAAGLCKKVVVEGQEKPYREGEYFVSIAE